MNLTDGIFSVPYFFTSYKVVLDLIVSNFLNSISYINSTKKPVAYSNNIHSQILIPRRDEREREETQETRSEICYRMWWWNLIHDFALPLWQDVSYGKVAQVNLFFTTLQRLLQYKSPMTRIVNCIKLNY